MLRKCLYILLLSILTNSLFSQQTINGTVTANGQPLFKANIYLPELYKGTTTNDKGEFILENIPKGDHAVQCSYLGYETTVKQIEVQAGSNEVEFLLEPTAIEGHEVVISTGLPSLQDENPVKIEQISINKITATGGTSLMEGLTSIPGVEQASTGIGIGKPVIRGLSFNRVLVYSQGVRLENQQWGGEHGLGLSAMGIDRVEIIKGPSSLLYGSDAMGGVIHIIDEKPADVGTVMGDYNAAFHSNTLGGSSNLGIKGSSKKMWFKVRGGAQAHADYQQGNDRRVTNSRFNERGLKTAIGLNGKWLTTTAAYNYSAANIGIPETDASQSTDYTPVLPFQKTTMHISSLQNTFYIGKSKLKANIGYTIAQRKEFEDEDTHDHGHEHEHEHEEEKGEEGPALDMKTGSALFDAKWYFPKWNKVELVIGTQGMHQQNTNDGEEQLVADATQQDVGGMALLKYGNEPVVVNIGVRYDRRKINPHESTIFPRNFNSFNSGLGVTFHIGHILHLRTNIATGFRAPNLAELTSNGVHHGANRYEIGNYNLKNEQNVELDVSGHFHSKHLTTDIAGYYNHIFDYIFLTPSNGSIINNELVYEYTQANARLYGGEFTFDLHPHPYDWLHLETVYSMVIGEYVSGGSPLPLIPAPKLRTTIKAELEKWGKLSQSYFSITSTFSLGQNNISSFETTTSPYNLWSAGLGTNISLFKQETTISITLNNIFNASYTDHLNLLKTNGLLNQGRNIAVNLKIPFGIKH